MFSKLQTNDKLYFLNINSITKNPELYIGTVLNVGAPVDPPIKPGEFRNPNIPLDKIMTVRVEILGNMLEYTVPASSTSVKDGDTNIYVSKDELLNTLKIQIDSHRLLYESINKQKQLYEKYNTIYNSIIQTVSSQVTDEKYNALLEENKQLKIQLENKEQHNTNEQNT